MPKNLKSALGRPSARETLPAVDTVAQEVGLPPATLEPRQPMEDIVQVNIRVRRSLGDQLADRARDEQTTQKVIICRALAAGGFEVHPEDLRAQPFQRRRGSARS